MVSCCSTFRGVLDEGITIDTGKAHAMSNTPLAEMPGDTPFPATSAVRVDIVVIGAGQAGLSSAYHLQRLVAAADAARASARDRP